MFGLDLSVVKIRVATVKQPAAPALNRHARMPAGMAVQWNEENLGWQANKVAHRVKTEPRLPRRFVELPLGSVRPLRLAVALSLLGASMFGAVFFALHQMNHGPREIAHAARVVQVEVGEHDVTNVLGVKPMLLHLANRGFAGVELGSNHGNEESPDSLPRVHHVGRAESGIDQHHTGVRLDQKAVAHKLAGLKERTGAVYQSATGWA